MIYIDYCYRCTVCTCKFLCPERKLVPSVTESTVPSRCITPAAVEVRSPQRSLTSSPLSLPPDNEFPLPKLVCGLLHVNKMEIWISYQFASVHDDVFQEDDYAPPRPPLPLLYDEDTPPVVPPLPKETSVIRHTSVRGLKRQSDERKRDRESNYNYVNGDCRVIWPRTRKVCFYCTVKSIDISIKEAKMTTS